jgi:hypothetical protein
MIVNIEAEDRTWQIHLDGLLGILEKPPFAQDTLLTDVSDPLRVAIQISKFAGNAFGSFATHNMNSLDKGFFILDVAMLCLRPLASAIEDLLQEATPRKIDIQKLRAFLRQIQKNLKLFPHVCPNAELDISKVSSRDRLMNVSSL